ncbi:MAG: endonuclease/exonuclease/phosphatase family protein [Bacteroidales bacterium]
MKRREFNRIYISWLVILAVLLFMFSAATALSQQADTFRIGTFNIQNFGKTKLNDSARVNFLAGIIRKYDIVAVQEISDVSGEVPVTFCKIINQKGNRHFAVAVSPLTGEQEDDKTSREQYAFFYDTTLFSLVSAPSLYNDSLHDYFAREPFTARFRTRSGGFTFVLITIHTTPKLATEEIGSLDDAVKWATEKYAKETEIVVLGDFNASCSYASPGDLDKLAIRGKNYFWVVPDDAKTNLSAKSDCAYDRFVLTLPAKAHYTGRWGVDRCFDSKTISDHWPVWAEFSTIKRK